MIIFPAAVSALVLNLVFGGSAPAPPRPKPLLAAGEVVGINLGVWAYVNYVQDYTYSYISWETIRDNFRDGWEWDRSQYFVNFYHHPYHGYLYFSAGRANGLGFWGSSLAALGGSLMWEMAMERWRPSINDLITTTAGGCVYGETAYRFSALVRKKNARWPGRIWRETLGTVLDPIGGITRLLSGRDEREPGLPGPSDAGRILDGQLVVSGPVISRSAGFSGSRAAPFLGFTLNYGDPAGAEWTGRAFDVFTVRGRLRFGPDKPHMSLFIHGALLGKSMGAGGSGSSHFLGLFQHYEYYGFDTMRVCGTSFTGGWTSRFDVTPSIRLTGAARLGWLGLGGSDDFLGIVGQRRSYNMATGITAAADLGVTAGGFEYFSAIWRHYSLFDLNVVGSRVGREAWDILEAQACLPVLSTVGIGAAAEYCGRSFNFRDFPSGSRRLAEFRAFLVWQF